MAGDRRLLWGVAVAGAVVVATAVVVALADQPAGAPGAYAVQVIGPDGPLYHGEVTVAAGTPLSVLAAAAAAGGFTYETERFPQFGCGIYVRSVAGHGAAGDAGWVYEVVRDGRTERPPMASCAYGLRPGDAVVWRWDRV